MEARAVDKAIVVDDLGLSIPSSAETISTAQRETWNSRGNEAVEAKGEDELIKGDCSMLQKDNSVDDEKITSAEIMEVAKACPHTEDTETNNVKTASTHEAMEPCSHTPQYESAEITLVVEMNTDAEVTVDNGLKGEEIMQREADTSFRRTASFQVVEQVSSSQHTEEGMATSPAIIYEHTGTSIDANSPQERMGKVQTPFKKVALNEPAVSDVHVDVETQSLAFDKGVGYGLSSKDETRGVGRKGEKQHIHADAQIREDSRELKAKAEGMSSEVSGLTDAMEGAENDEAVRKVEAVGASMEMVIETSDTEKGCMVIDVERETDTMSCVNEVFTGIMDGEIEKDGTAGQESARVKGALGIVEEMVERHGKEQEKSTTMLQMESVAKNKLLENEFLQAKSLQNLNVRDGSQEVVERGEGTIVSTEPIRNKDIVEVAETGRWGNTPTGMHANIIESDKQRVNVNVFNHMESKLGDRAKEGVQEMHHETEADTSDVVPLQQHMDVGKGPQLGIKQNECCRLTGRNNESGKEVGSEVRADQIALHLNKDMSRTVDFGQAGVQRQEESPGQDLQDSPAIQGSLQNLNSTNLDFEASCSEKDSRVQWDSQHNRQVHTEMQIRLLPDKSVKADLIRSHELLEGGPGMRMLKDLRFAKSKEAKNEESGATVGQQWRVGIVMQVNTKGDASVQERTKDTKMREMGLGKNQGLAFQGTGYENSSHVISRGGITGTFEEEKTIMSDNMGTSEEGKYIRAGFEKGDIMEKTNQKRKLSENLVLEHGMMNEHGQSDNVVKKAKKKAVNVWAKSSSRKGPKKNTKNGVPLNPANEDSVILTPVYVNPDKLEDGPDQLIALSKYDKAEKIELSENRLTASSTKGYRMVRATRGVQEGTWYFEIIVEQLGPTGHTRLGWSTQKGDVQAPVGFDTNSYGYRDLDGSKVHIAIREPYGDLYVEGDVIGFYINLPNGADYAPKPTPVLSYRGRPYLSDMKEEQPQKVPGSEICFFRNGVCQGTAFRDINAGRYFPAASMYTLPKEPSCIVRFNFGPEFRFPPVDIGDRPEPMPMASAPYHNSVNRKEVGPVALANVSATGNALLNSEPQIKIA